MWAFDEKGILRPTEFRHSDTLDRKWTEKDLDFIATFKRELKLRGLGNAFRLARYPGDDFVVSCEFTQGRANVNLGPEDVGNISLVVRPRCSQFERHWTVRIQEAALSLVNATRNKV